MRKVKVGKGNGLTEGRDIFSDHRQPYREGDILVKS